jgi:hypothetical protein
MFFFFFILAVKMSDDSKEPEILYCKWCINKYINAAELLIHVLENHWVDKSKCFDCTRPYSDGLINLVRHWIQEHMDSYLEKPKVYVCPTCGELFNKSVLLHRHKYNNHHFMMFNKKKI